ncbi:hypothetical protein N7E02_03610 (plasmid) [Aliirhizobium terrae]|uniref:hypothetical protein n=1 Tax=Terrirhizobium terrae TaxID=2926709 RepID=UPI0025759B66|nr:hypothetical protein [Rhizobium sp. CC-CFT758]WJH37872.1 hypothetical protein N7E02_03610 [Rhizobium sp. CC-CFT758]
MDQDGRFSGRQSAPSVLPAHDAVASVPADYSGMSIRSRRLLVLGLNVFTVAAFGYLVWHALSPPSVFSAETIMLVGFVLATPWTVLGFWNAVIGVFLLHGFGQPAKSVYPFYREGRGISPNRSLPKPP